MPQMGSFRAGGHWLQNSSSSMKAASTLRLRPDKFPERELSTALRARFLAIIPFGNFSWHIAQNRLIYSRAGTKEAMVRYTPAEIGAVIRSTRKNLGVTQRDLALTSGTGLRFIIELEKGKKTCELGKALCVLHTLGIDITLSPPQSRS